jgi:hypothetical protein
VSARPEDSLRPYIRAPLATPEETAREPAPFPATTTEEPFETGFPDWRRRLTRNLARHSVGRWEPLTRTHGAEG